LKYLFTQKGVEHEATKMARTHDYELEIKYKPRKAKIVADALSRKSQCQPGTSEDLSKKILEDLSKYRIEIVINKGGASVATLVSQPSLQDEIKKRQLEDMFITEETRRIREKQPSEFTLADDGIKRKLSPSISDFSNY
jgi:hypothetical protein